MESVSFSLSGWLNKMHALIRLLVIVSSFLLTAYPAHTQTKYLAGGYWIENYGKKEGLPEGVIIDIIQDRKGYLWITTPYNLVRFDGYEFKVFNPRPQFPDLYIHFYPGLIEDANGFLWISSNDKGLFSFDPVKQQFRRFYNDSTGNSLSDNMVSTILEDKKGNLWIGTGNGLNILSKKGENVSIRQFTANYPVSLLNMLDKVTLQNKPLSAITKAGDLESRSVPFEINKTTKLMVVCMAEGGGSPSDYGWIENDKNEKVWNYNDSKSSTAGGAAKNRLQLDIVTLSPGKYKLNYVSDDSHSWNNWNEAPPARADLWGIQLFQLPAVITDSIDLAIKNSLESPVLYGSLVKTLLQGTGNIIWALTNAGLEKLDTRDIGKGLFKSEKIVLPRFFSTSHLIMELDSNRLLLEGYLYHEKEKNTVLASLIYNYKNNSSTLQEENFFNILSFNHKCFLKDNQHNYWMGSFGNRSSGVYIADSGLEIPHFRKLDISPPESREPGVEGFDQVWTMFRDRSGNIWVGSRQNGLYKIKPVKVPALNTAISLAGDNKTAINFREIKEDAEGNIWLGSEQNGSFKYDPKTKQSDHFPAGNKASGKALFFHGKDNEFIIADPDKVSRYNHSTKGLQSFPVHIPDSLRLVGMDSNGNYWAALKGSNNSGLYYYYDGQQFQTITDGTGRKAFGYIRGFWFGKNGNVWMSPSFEGVYQYKWNTETKKLDLVKKYLPEGTDVYNIYEDDAGIIWMGTYDDGLIRLDPVKNIFKSFTKKEGLPSNFVFKVVPAGKKIWVLTDLGTALFDKETETLRTSKELDEYLGQNTDGIFTKFLYEDGFADFAVPTRSGDIAIVARNGFLIFNPDKFLKDTIKPVLQIARLQIDGQPIPFDGSDLKLKYFQNDLEIEYIGIHYDQPSKNQYAYFLKGANKDWINTGSGRIARFSNLPPGRYEFFMKAANADGVWSEPEQMMVFTILPPWWKTWWAYVLYALVFGAAVWLFIVYRSRRLKNENIILETKVSNRTAQLKESLENLKATQSQLIQSEKMASLGELTAGIAHEIQNPLNFVNNFSEVNSELIAEMKQEIEQENFNEVRSIADTIDENEKKIIFHGKRADSIVKGMLQHSRSSNAVKEPTDINKLADEYLRLAYHGLRAKDKSFNATMKTDFDESLSADEAGIGNINIIPQDIGRVILNLITNAFYVVNEKKALRQAQGDSYEPTVSITTKKVGDKVEIKVKDNGNGIPQKVLDKIFQPFFTTKPTGQGTGLGLSLSYDIVKAHGGEITVATKENEGSEFRITLPA